MPNVMDLDIDVIMPEIDADVEQVITEALQEAGEQVVRNVRTGQKSWTDQTGRLSASFSSRDIRDGTEVRNTMRYAGAVREFDRAPPLGVLVLLGLREMATRNLEERGDDIATAALNEIMLPLVKAARELN